MMEFWQEWGSQVGMGGLFVLVALKLVLDYGRKGSGDDLTPESACMAAQILAQKADPDHVNQVRHTHEMLEDWQRAIDGGKFSCCWQQELVTTLVDHQKRQTAMLNSQNDKLGKICGSLETLVSLARNDKA